MKRLKTGFITIIGIFLAANVYALDSERIVLEGEEIDQEPTLREVQIREDLAIGELDLREVTPREEILGPTLTSEPIAKELKLAPEVKELAIKPGSELVEGYERSSFDIEASFDAIALPEVETVKPTLVSPAATPDLTLTSPKVPVISISSADTTLAVYGDSNGDGILDSQDIQALLDYIFSGGPEPANGDINGDGEIDVSDVVALRDFLQGLAEDIVSYVFQGGDMPLSGDANGDGQINIADAVWINNQLLSFGALSEAGDEEDTSPAANLQYNGQDLSALLGYIFSGGPEPANGDVNGDGEIDVADAVALRGAIENLMQDILDYVFSGAPQPANADVNGDGEVNVADVTWLANQLNLADNQQSHDSTTYSISHRLGPDSKLNLATSQSK